MNDASYTQKILDSYSGETEGLEKVANKYDPNALFQELQGDGFLLRKL